MNKIDIHIICGPTASGKSAHAMQKASELNGVIINCDSQQIYDALPILNHHNKIRIKYHTYSMNTYIPTIFAAQGTGVR